MSQCTETEPYGPAHQLLPVGHSKPFRLLNSSDSLFKALDPHPVHHNPAVHQKHFAYASYKARKVSWDHRIIQAGKGLQEVINSYH